MHRSRTLLCTALVCGLCELAIPATSLAQFQGGMGRTTGTSRSGLSSQSRSYRSNTLIGDALIEIDTETRSLIIISDDETNQEIGRIIESLDQPKPQVLIKVLFVEVTHSDKLDLGVEASFNYSEGDVQQGTVESIWNLAEETDGVFWRMLAPDWNATIRALAENGKLEVLSRPSILARNNQEAVIVVGQEVPFVTNSRITTDGQTINTIEYAEIGIILRVTPFIAAEGLVEMIVAPEISTLTNATMPISETVNSPIIATRSAETVVVTKNGRPVVIGGLMENAKEETIRKLPLLGDIPLLGAAFRRRVTKDAKKELLIFLTPYIIEDPGKVADLARSELGGARIATQAFPGNQLDEALPGLIQDLPPDLDSAAAPEPDLEPGVEPPTELSPADAPQAVAPADPLPPAQP